MMGYELSFTIFAHDPVRLRGLNERGIEEIIMYGTYWGNPVANSNELKALRARGVPVRYVE